MATCSTACHRGATGLGVGGTTRGTDSAVVIGPLLIVPWRRVQHPRGPRRGVLAPMLPLRRPATSGFEWPGLDGSGLGFNAFER